MSAVKSVVHNMPSWHAQRQFYSHLTTAIIPNNLFGDAASTVLCLGLHLHFISAPPGVGEDKNHIFMRAPSPRWMGFLFAVSDTVILTPMPVAGRGNVQQNVISEIQ
jgi:hypothetical protein